MANSVDPDQTAPIGAVCYGSTLFACILNSSVMLGNYLQQTNSADDIFRCIFFLALYEISKSFLASSPKHSSTCSFTLKTAVHKQLHPLIYCCKQGYYLYLILQRCFPLEPLLELDGSTYIPSSQTCHFPSK